MSWSKLNRFAIVFRLALSTLLFSWIALLETASGAAVADDKSPSTLPEFVCEVRYHFRERLDGIQPGGKKFSAPADEREALPRSRLVRSNGEQMRIVEGGVAHLPYRFAIKLTRSQDTNAETIEVTLVDSKGKPLSGYPQTVGNPFTKAAGPGNKQFKIPISKELAKTIEKELLAKNQFLTHVDLSIDYSP